MKCNECRYMMFDYVDNNLSVSSKLEVERHLGECADCAARMAQMKGVREEEKPAGLFWYLLRPSGGFKSFFLLGAVLTLILVLVLLSMEMKKPLFSLLRG